MKYIVLFLAVSLVLSSDLSEVKKKKKNQSTISLYFFNFNSTPALFFFKKID